MSHRKNPLHTLVRGGGLTGVCKREIIATNCPLNSWIPAYAGMTEWAR